MADYQTFGKKMKPYFAYGSNLCRKRFTDPSRVPSAKFESLAILEGYRIVFNKRSIDGSGKATIVRDSESKVIGALFTYDEREHERLKKVEGGYLEEPITVLTAKGSVDAVTFVRDPSKLDSSLQPYDWYVALIRAGGRDLGLPEDYLSQFDQVATIIDPDTAQAAKERAFLE